MRVSATGILVCVLSAAMACGAQPDFMRQADPVTPAPADAAILHAIGLIDTSRIDQTIKTLVGYDTRNSLSSMEQMPAGKGVEGAGDWIASEFERISKGCGGCLEVKRDTFIADPASAAGSPWANRIPKATRMTNVYAILRGNDPAQARRMYLVTGHYDSRNLNVMDARGTAPGANDDASGVAVSLECARALSTLHLPATVVFVAVAGEEQGLVGSAHLAHLAREQRWQLESVLNNDIVGGNTTPGEMLQMKDRVRVFSESVPASATPDQAKHIRAVGGENDSPSRQLARAMADTARTYFSASSAAPFGAFLVSRPDRYLRGGDHTSFNREGFAAVRLTEWREDYNHQHQNVVLPASGSSDPVLGDLPQFVDFNYVAKVARLNAAVLATLAASPGEPAKVAINTQKLENGTTLTWEPAPGDVAHYEVLWRETTAPDWQFARDVAPPAAGAPITVTLPVSKDNVIFGVRGVDAAGHRGLVVVP
jgi:Zn-dependent M28 family amino/carboxypeptidase